MKKITLWSLLLFLSITINAQQLTSYEKQEINKAKQELQMSQSQVSQEGSFEEKGLISKSVMADFVPTAGATESFSPASGDFFYDTGGPGGGGLNASGTSGTELPGNYLNCSCVTTTTLSGVTEIEFSVFEVFGDFDWLIVYDGVDTSGDVLYDSNTNANTDTFAGMLALNGSGVFTGTSGAITFEFSA